MANHSGLTRLLEEEEKQFWKPNKSSRKGEQQRMTFLKAKKKNYIYVIQMIEKDLTRDTSMVNGECYT